MKDVVLTPVPYSQLLEDVRAIIRQENAERNNPTAPEIGGIELAEELTRLSRARLYTLVSQRTIPHSKRGNKLYFSRAELMAWVAAGHRAETTTPPTFPTRKAKQGSAKKAGKAQ